MQEKKEETKHPIKDYEYDITCAHQTKIIYVACAQQIKNDMN
jgi:hypothetical protein